MIPENEKWLYENPEALKSVLQGLKEASEGKFADFTPDLEKDSGMLEFCKCGHSSADHTWIVNETCRPTDCSKCGCDEFRPIK